MAKVVKESDIKRALAFKHGNDFYIDNIKTGATYFNKMLRILDFWAMKKSWAHPLTICYEIKVSRSDFNADTKWPEYLDYADMFLFAVPKGLVTADEVIAKAQKADINPDYVGLIYIHHDRYTRIIKPALDRNVEIDEDFYRYILMNKIYSDRIPFYNDKRDFLEAWLDNKRKDRDIGWRVGSKMAKKIRDQADDIWDFESIIDSIDRAFGIKLKSWTDVRKLKEIISQGQLL